MPVWTDEQQQVIHARGCNLLVSAAAGSGKTAVLVERILQLLTDSQHPVDIDRLLMVTFTNAAAGEMKDRIRAALEKRAEELPGDEEKLQERLQRQISLLPGAQITTIHSFCQYVIRNYFHTIDIDPALRIADEGEQKLLQSDVMEDLLEECYAQGGEDFLRMAECFAPARDDRSLGELALSLYRFSRSFPFPEKWLRQCAESDLTRERAIDRLPWMGRLMELTEDVLADVQAQIKEALDIAYLPEGPYMYGEALQSDLEQVQTMRKADTYTGRSDAFAQLFWARLSAKKDAGVSEELRQRAKSLRDGYKKILGDLKDEFFYAPPQTLLMQMEKSAPALRAMTDLTCRFSERYAQEKQKKGLMDFDDLEHFALQILVREEDGKILPTQAALDLKDYYEEILIDEYQDSNLVQEIILNSISRGNNMVMVGDVKQSIYRFRLARPELFMEKFYAYAKDGSENRRIDLHKNFRSRSQVLSGVNMLFEQLMERRLGNIDYNEEAALYPGADFAEGGNPAFYNTEVMLLDVQPPVGEDEKQPDGEDGPEETAREMEARAVAGRIRRILEEKEPVWDKEENRYRAARYDDIVILLRTVQGWADVFSRVLGELGIPAHTGSRTGYFSATEVQTVLSLLRVIDNPRQDIPLTAVLRSPIAGLSGQELAGIRSAHPEVPFYQACMEEETLRPFFAMLEEFRDMAAYLPIHELLWHILSRTGYGAYAAAMPGGAQRRANLDMLIQKAAAYESGSYHGLYHFVRYIENLHKYDIDFGEAETGETGNAVRILSIHKSKGLEFPIVFVCGMGKQINQADARAALVTHAQLGIGCDCVDPVLRTRSATLHKQLIKRCTVYENLGEELRVLYVALTRAKEKLILTGTVSDLPGKLQKWAGICQRQQTPLAFMTRASALCFWDWVVPALMRSRCFAPFLPEGVVQMQDHPLYGREIFCEVHPLTAKDLIFSETQRQKAMLFSREELLNLPLGAVFDGQEAQKLRENLSFSYAYAKESALPSKVSVSELKRLGRAEPEEEGVQLYEEETPVPLLPRFLTEKSAVSGAARGTIYHRLMECLDFALFAGGVPEEEQLDILLRKELARVTAGGYLTEEECAQIDAEKIKTFLKSPLAARMAAAAAGGRLYREKQFVLEDDIRQAEGDAAGGGRVLIQGIIDAYFIEDGEIVLLDYKTDFVKLQEVSSLYEKYAVQLEYYERALRRLTHLPVKEKMIYSFCLGRIVKQPS